MGNERLDGRDNFGDEFAETSPLPNGFGADAVDFEAIFAEDPRGGYLVRGDGDDYVDVRRREDLVGDTYPA